ncbi:MAG TPA: hypothetical protein VGM37_05535 [Armatimonadota bacterium]|jgi:hypothetical protein
MADPLYEFEMDAGSHAYRIEVLTARNGRRYLKVTDYPLEKDGVRLDHGVLLFPEYASRFWWGLTQAMARLAGDDSDRIRDAMPPDPIRAGLPWTEGEDARLRLAYSQGIAIKCIAAMLQRNEGGIESRLKRLGLIR